MELIINIVMMLIIVFPKKQLKENVYLCVLMEMKIAYVDKIM